MSCCGGLFTAKKFVLTLDEDLYGDKMVSCTEKLFSLKIPATIFVDFKTTMSRSYVRELKDQGFDLQMHWVRYPRRKYAIFGRYIGYFFKEEPSFERQKAALESLLDKDIIGNRTHGLEWKCPFPRKSRDDFVYPWRVMFENGIKFSSSVFGFPSPFRPSDLANKSFDLLEIPITHYEQVPSEKPLIVGLYHPHYEVWYSAVEWALQHHYEFLTMEECAKELLAINSA